MPKFTEKEFEVKRRLRAFTTDQLAIKALARIEELEARVSDLEAQIETRKAAKKAAKE